MQILKLSQYITSKLILRFLLVVSSMIVSGTTYAALNNPFAVDVPLAQRTAYSATSSASCPYSLMKPVTQDLIIGSKYDQSDSSKSTLTSGSVEGAKIKQAIDSFSKNISKYTDYAIFNKSSEKKAVALQCILDNLDNWAKAGALVDVEATGNGQATRKWFLASISSSILKLQAVYPQINVSKNVKNWLNDLALDVYAYYNPRFQKRTKWFNNHDHWAAFAVGLSSLVNNNTTGIKWVKKVFDYSLSLAVEEKNTGGLYFKNEVARGHLGAEYMNFSMVPLVFMADYLRLNNLLTDENWEDIQLLAQFTKDITLHADKLALGLDEQKEVGLHRTIWVLPYKRVMDSLGAKNTNTKRVLTELETSGTYTSVGGNLKPFYP